MIVTLKKLKNNPKKFQVTIVYSDGTQKTVKFGASGYSDYTLHKDPERKKRYVIRHSKGNENWNKSGIATAGFWSRWLLWNLPSLSASIKDTERRFSLKIKRE